jgi:hypothetical protein
MCDLSGELTVILVTIWWLQNLGKYWQEVNKKHRNLMWRENFNLRKLRELEFRKQYQTHISNRFVAWENLSDSKDINRAWENKREYQDISYREPRSV